jgi:hypothetical protein
VHEEPGPRDGAGAVARLANHLAGGIHHLAADRALGEEIEARWPGAQNQVRHARLFRSRAVAWAVAQGCRGLIVAGAGYPRPAMPHGHARGYRQVPAVYADPDPEVAGVRRVVIGDDPRMAACLAQTADPGGLLSRREVAELPRPWCVLVCSAPCFWPAGLAREVIAGYSGLLPPGSALVLSTGLPDGGPDGAELAAMLSPLGRVYRHPPEAVQGWLDAAGLETVPPGVVDVRAWPDRAGLEAEFARRRPGRIIGAVARVPSPSP